MSENDLIKNIKLALCEVLEIEIKSLPNFNKKSKLMLDFNLDSLSFVQFIIKLEELTGVDIPDLEAEQCETVEDLIKCIKKNNI